MREIDENLVDELFNDSQPMTNVVDDDDEDETLDVEALTMSQEERRQRRLAKKPYVEHLEDGIKKNEDGTYAIMFKPMERVVVERMSTLLAGNPWLNTKVYTVRSIDESSGHIDLEDEDLMNHSMVNFKSKFSRIKLAPRIGDPFKVVIPKVIVQRNDGTIGPRRRGRPKGSKSRPKDVIEQERCLSKAAKKEKRMRKNARL